MKKITAVLLIVVLLFSFVSCSGDKFEGSYSNSNRSNDESTSQVLDFKDGVCDWNERGITFHGTYVIDGDTVTITMDGGGVASDKVFVGTIDGNTILLTGGSLAPEGEPFEKQ